jgi:hypothetical protein
VIQNRKQRRLGRRVLLILFALCLSAIACAQGGPPLITDDPGTPGDKHWEINVAFTDTNYPYGTVVEIPHLDLNYGYGKNLQLKLEGPLTVFDGQGRNYATLGYTNWGVKWRYQEETKTKPALSIYPQILFVGNQDLSRLGVLDPGTDLYLPAEALKTFGGLILDVEAGVLFRQFAQTQLTGGVCAEYDLRKNLALLGEVHNIVSTGLVSDELVWNLGFKFDFSEHESLLASAGRGFSTGPDEPSFETYLGIQFRT